MERSTNSVYVVEPSGRHTHTFILLHGLGSNGEKFGMHFLNTATNKQGVKLVDMLPFVRFIFPTAKRRRSSAFRRAQLTQWFDIASLQDPALRQEKQCQGLSESAAEILDLINKEAGSIPWGRIILGGLSQGCAMSLSILLSLDHPLGGFVGMSGWLPFQKDLAQVAADADEDDLFSLADGATTIPQHPITRVLEFERDLLSLQPQTESTEWKTALATPVFLGHGGADEKVGPHLGEAAAQTLKSVGFQITWRLYPELGHWYQIPDEIEDICSFLRDQAQVPVDAY
jgi:predicted esterase